MSPIIVKSRALGDVVGVRVVDEILNLFAVFLLVLGLILVVDFGLDIEEGCPPVSPALPAMTLARHVSYCPVYAHHVGYLQSFQWRSPNNHSWRKMCGETRDAQTHLMDVLVLVILFFVFFVIVNVLRSASILLLFFIFFILLDTFSIFTLYFIFSIIRFFLCFLCCAVDGAIIFFIFTILIIPMVAIRGAAIPCILSVFAAMPGAGNGSLFVVGEVCRRRVEVIILGFGIVMPWLAGRHFGCNQGQRRITGEAAKKGRKTK